jgi:phosphotriesterase-related protein
MPGSELDSRWWKSPEQRYAETVPKLRQFHEYGGGTFVDATGICNGRDIDYYKTLSAKTGVHIVACTGFVGGDTALPHFARASGVSDDDVRRMVVDNPRTLLTVR